MVHNADIGNTQENMIAAFNRYWGIAPEKEAARIGVEFGDNYIYFLRLSSEKNGREASFSKVEITPESDLVAILKHELTSFCIKELNVQIWSFLKDSKITLRQTTTPYGNPDDIGTSVELALHKEIGFSFENTVFDFEPVNTVKSREGHRVVVNTCLISRSTLIEYEKLFNDAGFPLTGITMDCFTRGIMFKRGYFGLPDEPILLLGIHRSGVDVVIYSGKKVAFSRNISIGVNDLSKAISDSFNISLLEARDMLHRMSSLDQEKRSAVIEAVWPVWSNLSHRIDETLELYQSTIKDEEMSKILVSGGYAANSDLIENLEATLEIPVEVVNPFKIDEFSNVVGGMPEFPHEFLGAAQLCAANSLHVVNLLKPFHEKVRNRWRIRFLKKATQLTVASAMLLFVVMGIFMYLCSVEQEKMITLQKDSRGPVITEDVLRVKVKHYMGLIRSLDEKSRKLSSLSTLKALIALLPEQAVLKSIMINVNGGREVSFSLKVVGDKEVSKHILEAFIINLEQNQHFYGVKVHRKHYDAGSSEFSLACRVKALKRLKHRGVAL